MTFSPKAVSSDPCGEGLAGKTFRRLDPDPFPTMMPDADTVVGYIVQYVRFTVLVYNCRGKRKRDTKNKVSRYLEAWEVTKKGPFYTFWKNLAKAEKHGMDFFATVPEGVQTCGKVRIDGEFAFIPKGDTFDPGKWSRKEGEPAWGLPYADDKATIEAWRRLDATKVKKGDHFLEVVWNCCDGKKEGTQKTGFIEPEIVNPVEE